MGRGLGGAGRGGAERPRPRTPPAAAALPPPPWRASWTLSTAARAATSCSGECGGQAASPCRAAAPGCRLLGAPRGAMGSERVPLAAPSRFRNAARDPAGTSRTPLAAPRSTRPRPPRRRLCPFHGCHRPRRCRGELKDTLSRCCRSCGLPMFHPCTVFLFFFSIAEPLSAHVCCLAI